MAGISGSSIRAAISRRQASWFSEAAESTMTRSARSAIAANSCERGENPPGYHRNTGRSGIRSGPAKLSRCLAAGPSACIVTCSAQTCALLPPLSVTEGRKPHVHVRFAFGVGDQYYGPSWVAARQLRDRVGDLLCRLLVGHHDQVEHAGAEGERPVVVRAQFAKLVLYLPDAHPSAAGGLARLPDHGLLHSLPSRSRSASASSGPQVPAG